MDKQKNTIKVLGRAGEVEIEVRYLDRQQIRDLRDKGLHPSFQTPSEDRIEQRKRDADLIDYVLDTLYKPEELAGVRDKDQQTLAMACWALTYPQEEIKNLLPSTDGGDQKAD